MTHGRAQAWKSPTTASFTYKGAKEGFFLSFYPRVGSDGALQIPPTPLPQGFCCPVLRNPAVPRLSLLSLSHLPWQGSSHRLAPHITSASPSLGSLGECRAPQTQPHGWGWSVDGRLCTVSWWEDSQVREREGADNLLAFNSPGVLGLNTKCSLVSSQ